MKKKSTVRNKNNTSRQTVARNTVEPTERKFPIKSQKKLVVLFIIVLLAFVGLGFRLIWITRQNGIQYEKQILSQQRYDSTTLPYRRGDIVDANGTQLAVSEKVYNLVIDSTVMLSDEEYLEPTLEALGMNFPMLNMGEIREYVITHPNSAWYVPVKRLRYDEIAGFKSAQVENKNIKGVWFEEEYKRIYPYSALACDVLGFTTSDNVGQYGLEEYYNDVLNGTAGREYGYLNDDSTLERTTIPATDGNTIHSTIDINIQGIIEKYLQKFNEDNKNAFREGNGAENVGCIVMEVNTGEILGMASYPNFDLNNTRNTDALIGMSQVHQITNANGYFEIKPTGAVINEELIQSMTDDEILLNLNNLWKNYCISNTYEPGSTAKPFTVAAGLESGAINQNTTYECNGNLQIGGFTIKCHNKYGDGVLTLQEGIARSCNVVLMKVGQAMGIDTFCDFQHIFNFGLKTNIDLAGEARTASLIYDRSVMGPTDLATNTFGQNFNVTMVQLITGFCSLINGGYYYEPHIVDKITNSSGATVQTIEPRVLKQTVSESTSELIRSYCRAVVMPEGGEHRTGRTARPAGYAIGGKTGTAETIDPVTNSRNKTDYVVSFIGFAPADDPQIAIYVVVDRPNSAFQADAKFATGIVRNVLTEVLPYLNIYMTEELSEKEIDELNALSLEITTQYTKNDDVLYDENGNIISDNSVSENEIHESEITEGSNANEPDWSKFSIDQATGYLVDPATGEMYDPETKFLIGGGLSDAPVNNNIISAEE